MKVFFLIITGLILHITAFCQDSKTLLPNTFYKEGEKLEYVLRYGFITGGTATLELKDSVYDKVRLYHLKATAKTSGIADKIFKVKDIYESYFDKSTGLPLLAIQNIREGKTYKYYNEVRYYRKNNIVVSSKSGLHKVKDDMLDIVSAFYYIRRMDFSKSKNGDVYKFNTFFSDEDFPFEIRFRGREDVKTEWGKIKCLKFAPVVEPGRVFKSKDDMLIWYTDDANKIPVKITFELIVGHVTVELTNFSNLRTKPVFKD
jgi:hypothetical protein